MSLITHLIESHYKPLILNEKERREKHNTQYIFFIDCFDLIDLLKGVKRFSEDNERRDNISNPRTLTYNLLLNGWIDNIHLLPTHQTEFFDLMYLDFGIRNPHINDTDIDSLIAEYEVDASTEPEEDYNKFITRVVEKAVDRFNIFGLSRENNWQKRLKRLVDQKILQLKDYDLRQVIKLVPTENFRKIKLATDKVRPRSTRNKSNFNDALALTYLSTLIDANKVPVLLDSKGFYTKIVNRANLKHKFSYEIPSNNGSSNPPVSIIRDAAYFVLKSIFDCPLEKLNVINKKFPKYYLLLESGTSKKVISIDHVLKSKRIENFFLEDSKLEKIYNNYKVEFQEYLENEFFNKVWLSSYEDSSFRKFLSDHYTYQKQDVINKTEVINAYKKSFIETYTKVKKESEILSALTSVWSDLNNLTVSKIISNSDDIPLHALMSFGSFRFSLPFNKHLSVDEINAEIDDLLFEDGLTGNKVTKNYAIHKIIKLLFDGINDNCLHSLSVAVAVLWSLGRYKSLNKIFSYYYKGKKYPYYAFPFIHSAALLQITTLQHNRSKVLEIINGIDTKGLDENYKYLIGKSFVANCLWQAEFKDTFSAVLHPINHNNIFFASSDENVSAAIDYLRQNGYQKNEWKKMLYIYALNLKIYIITEGGNQQEFLKLESLIDIFKRAENDFPVYWQYRYDDTIARYNLRLALNYYNERNIEGFTRYLERASNRIDRAMEFVCENRTNQENFQDKIFEIKTKFEKQELDKYLKSLSSNN